MESYFCCSYVFLQQRSSSRELEDMLVELTHGLA